MAQTAKKMNKPLMEKKRRARINSCLAELKTLVLHEMKKDHCMRMSYSKLEKADILEMTVQYLRNLQRQQIINAASLDSNVIEKYLSGYTECTNEVARYMNLMDGVDKDCKQSLLKHLNSGVQTVAGTKVLSTIKTAHKEPSRQTTCSPKTQSEHINQILTANRKFNISPPHQINQQPQFSSHRQPVQDTKPVIHNTSMSVEALERLSYFATANSSPTSINPSKNNMQYMNSMAPIEIKPCLTNSLYTVSPKDFESVDSGICDRAVDCSNSSLSGSSDDERDLRSDCSDRFEVDMNNNQHTMSDANVEDEFMWRPW